jgi:hypothetical protein
MGIGAVGGAYLREAVAVATSYQHSPLSSCCWHCARRTAGTGTGTAGTPRNTGVVRGAAATSSGTGALSRTPDAIAGPSWRCHYKSKWNLSHLCFPSFPTLSSSPWFSESRADRVQESNDDGQTLRSCGRQQHQGRGFPCCLPPLMTTDFPCCYCSAVVRAAILRRWAGGRAVERHIPTPSFAVNLQG